MARGVFCCSIGLLLLDGRSRAAALRGHGHAARARSAQRSSARMATADDTAADANEPAARASGPAPEAWREFRAQLIAGGIRLTTEDAAAAAPSTEAQPRVVVARRNEELLRAQNAQLYDEYVNGAWAHVSPPEPGGLMCRLPLQAQIMYFMRDERRTGECAGWGELMRERLRSELPTEPPAATDGADAAADGGGGSGARNVYAEWLANTAYCYRLVESTVLETMRGMQQRARTRGPLDSSGLKGHELALLRFFSAAQDCWQEVCLVTSTSAPDRAEGVVINRPLAKAIDRQLAKLLLGGERPGAPEPDERALDRLVGAFGAQAGVYVGGPDAQREPALFVHGIDGLSGAVEVSPGTRIFTGGLDAAIDGVISGTYKPLDFRFFVGRTRALSTAQGEYIALACARPIALKQCLGLPKPLWHEVMELAGGECAQLSRMEITKRDDLTDE
ncbi:hypothetical protein KFE25_003063 [Diacronema lutheri]|uniref:Uncharacterized protein n=3 Tax=Diacronema lutheri TaxID=2081491 RepID=A0A8J6C8J3_DIALT|nr:hypothetical protein KFE25_003063 [Diacronema lutheri]